MRSFSVVIAIFTVVSAHPAFGEVPAPLGPPPSFNVARAFSPAPNNVVLDMQVHEFRPEVGQPLIQAKSQRFEESLLVDGIRVTSQTAGGERIEPSKLLELLKTPKRVLVVANQLDPYYLDVIRPDTIVIVVKLNPAESTVPPAVAPATFSPRPTTK